PRKSPRARTACARDMPGGTRSDAQGGPPLRFNVLEHQLVPEHRLVAEEDADRVLKALKITRDQLPKIRKSDPVIQVLDKIEDRTEGDVIEIRIGRKRDDRGRIDLEAKPTITLGLPVVKEANGATHPLNPMESRLRNLNYTAPIYLDFTVIENGIEREPERVHIGNFPIMVKSKRCLLYKENMETEGELTLDEYRRKLIEDTQEDPFDPGGYFIIGGTERALISLED